MKNILIGIFSLTLLASCEKVNRKAEIDRDCTGTYIRLNNRDYLICNPASVNTYPNGSKIKVKYQTVYDCDNDPNQSICELYHKHFGTIEITEVEP